MHGGMIQAPFAFLIKTVMDYLSVASPETRVWIDVFAVNQHGVWPPQDPPQTPSHFQNKADVGAFKDVIDLCVGGTLVVAYLDANCNPARRGWCLYEWCVVSPLFSIVPPTNQMILWLGSRRVPYTDACTHNMYSTSRVFK